jgi:ABC-type multidrug transport system fused ATPase/permease subunit
MPSPLDRLLLQMDIMSSYGSWYFILAPMLLFMFLMQELAKDKELHLRHGLNVVGVGHAVYWVHWVIVATILNFLQVMVLMISGYICQFELWKNCDFGILFTIFFWFGQTMVAMAFCISTMITTQLQGNNISYTSIVTLLLVNIIFANTDWILRLFYSSLSEGSGFVSLFLDVLMMLPPYQYVMAFGLTARAGGARLNYDSMSWTPGAKFGSAEYYADIREIAQATGAHIHAPSVASFMSSMYWTQFWIWVLWWYLDHVLASNRGVAYCFYFMFQKQYWVSVLPTKYKQRIEESRRQKLKRPYTQSDLGIGLTSEDTLNSTQLEQQKVMENEEKDIYPEGLRIVDIKKTYFKLPFGLKSKKDVSAVKGIHLEVAKNETLCLLGHNGAGKSTLFNMMTGIISATSGSAKICGQVVGENQDKIR